MKSVLPFALLLVCLTPSIALAQDPPVASEIKVSLHPSTDGSGLELSWPTAVTGPDGKPQTPFFEVQRSFDLNSWVPVGERVRGAVAPASPRLRQVILQDATAGFYRVIANLPQASQPLAVGGDEVLGYAQAFDKEFKSLGPISTDDFTGLFPSDPNYLDRLTWNPTTAEFWHEFSTDPETINRENEQKGVPERRWLNYQLTETELNVFTNRGFVVSERLGATSFARVFYNLWRNDLPVFISTDAILQAWHRTYDALLEETEETFLFNSVETLLAGMADQIEAASVAIGNGPLRDSLLDSDYFVAVASSLLSSETSILSPSHLGQDARVAETLALIQAEKLTTLQEFMGSCRVVDFSQFKVRGHYTHSERLGRYFKCLMWLGRTDVAVAGGPFDRGCGPVYATPRELGTAIVLRHLIHASNQFDNWLAIEQIIETYVGPTDSLTVAQLGGVLAGAGVAKLEDIRDVAQLEKIQADLLAGDLGLQNIRSDYFVQHLGPEGAYGLPRSFTVLGQKFIPDSWVFSQTTGAPGMCPRNVPSALDMAFAVLANDAVVPELVNQMLGRASDLDRPHAHQRRDGYQHQQRLAAARRVMDQQTPDAWRSNLYMDWLDCLRQLSLPTTDGRYPEAMRTRAWGSKTLNTQLASWTHLRHDTILYAKQSYGMWGECRYPTGYVEPRLEFWSRLKQMASQAASRVAALRFSGTYSLPRTQEQIPPLEIPLPEIQARQVSHLRNFAETVGQLERIARKELEQACLTAEETSFINSLMEGSMIGYTGREYYTGWYPQLLYRTIYWPEQEPGGTTSFQTSYGAGAPDGLVSDVHTDTPSQLCGDVGSVLHQAVGKVNLLMLAAENGGDRFICAGPVLSHYEFEVTGPLRRLTDEEWRGPAKGVPGILDGSFPDDVPSARIEGLTPPPWTSTYLVPLSPEP